MREMMESNNIIGLLFSDSMAPRRPTYERNFSLYYSDYTEEPLNSDHIGDKHFGHYSEVGPFLEVPPKFVLYTSWCC